MHLSTTKRAQQNAERIGDLITSLEKTNAALLNSLEQRSKSKEDVWCEADDKVFEEGLKSVEQNREQIRELQQQLVELEAPRGQSMPVQLHGHSQQQPAHRGDVFQTDAGVKIRALRPEEKVSQQQSQPEVGVGEFIRAITLNDYSRIPQHVLNEQTISSDSGGGYLLPSPVSSMVVDLARSASVAIRSGAQTLAMSGSELNIARVSGDPTGHWRAEGVEVQSSSVTFDRVTLRPRTLAAIVPASIELLEDSVNCAAVIEQTLQRALGAALDAAILSGSGAASTPLGIRNHDDVLSIASVGTPSDYTPLTSAVADILTANYAGEVSDLAWIGHPRDFETFVELADSTGQPLQAPEWARDLKRFPTTSVATDEGGGSNESFAIVGNTSEVLIGMRTSGVNIRVASDGVVNDGASDLNATSQLLRHIVCYLRADVAILQPTHLCVLSGITA